MLYILAGGFVVACAVGLAVLALMEPLRSTRFTKKAFLLLSVPIGVLFFMSLMGVVFIGNELVDRVAEPATYPILEEVAGRLSTALSFFKWVVFAGGGVLVYLTVVRLAVEGLRPEVFKQHNDSPESAKS